MKLVDNPEIKSLIDIQELRKQYFHLANKSSCPSIFRNWSFTRTLVLRVNLRPVIPNDARQDNIDDSRKALAAGKI